MKDKPRYPLGKGYPEALPGESDEQYWKRLGLRAAWRPEGGVTMTASIPTINQQELLRLQMEALKAQALTQKQQMDDDYQRRLMQALQGAQGQSALQQALMNQGMQGLPSLAEQYRNQLAQDMANRMDQAFYNSLTGAQAQQMQAFTATYADSYQMSSVTAVSSPLRVQRGSPLARAAQKKKKQSIGPKADFLPAIDMDDTGVTVHAEIRVPKIEIDDP